MPSSRTLAWQGMVPLEIKLMFQPELSELGVMQPLNMWQLVSFCSLYS